MQFSANQIASLVNGVVEGNGDVLVSTIANIDCGQPGAITFLANPKYTHYIYNTACSIVLVRSDFKAEQPVNATLIRVQDPYATVAQLLDMVSKMTEPQYIGIEQPTMIASDIEVPDGCYIGAFSYIAKGVKLGKNVKIFPQCYVGDNVIIGDNTVLKPGVKVYHGCKIGNNCILHSGVVIGGDGFGFAPVNGEYNKIPQIGNVVIEDNVEIGANTTIDRATMSSTIIRHGVKLDNLIQIAHNVEIGENTVIAAQTGVAGSTKIGARNMIAGQVGFAGHIKVGDDNQIGAQSGIPNNVGSAKRLMGYPAVEGRDYARQTVYIKKLGELFNRVDNIEKTIKK